MLNTLSRTHCDYGLCNNILLHGSKYCLSHTAWNNLPGKKCPIYLCNVTILPLNYAFCEQHEHMYEHIFINDSGFYIRRTSYTKSYVDFAKLIDITHRNIKNNDLYLTKLPKK